MVISPRTESTATSVTRSCRIRTVRVLLIVGLPKPVLLAIHCRCLPTRAQRDLPCARDKCSHKSGPGEVRVRRTWLIQDTHGVSAPDDARLHHTGVNPEAGATEDNSPALPELSDMSAFPTHSASCPFTPARRVWYFWELASGADSHWQ